MVLGTSTGCRGFSVWNIPYIKEELLIVLGTSSSESGQPRIAKMENLGACKSLMTSKRCRPTVLPFNLRRYEKLPDVADWSSAPGPPGTPMTLTQQLTMPMLLLPARARRA